MKYRILGCSLLIVLVAASARAQQDCPSGKPALLTGAVPRALGKGPVWLTAESIPIKWEGAASPVQLIWLIDAGARGAPIVSGKHRDSGAPVRFTKLGDRVGKKEPRYRLDPLGYKPTYSKPADFKKYSFDRTFGWFPQPGCYEITGQMGKQESKIYLQVTPAAK